MAIPSGDDLDAALGTAAFYDDPYPTYDRLRAADPVHWSEHNGGWMLTCYDDVLATIRDVTHFTSRGRFAAVFTRMDPEVRQRVAPMRRHFSVGLIASDPPDHTRMRGLINRAMKPRVIEAMRPRIQALVTGMLDAVIARGEMDLIADLAYPLPATVIAEMLGAPAESRDQFKVWSRDILGFQGTGRPDPVIVDRAQESLLAMRAFLSELAADRRESPKDDLLGLLVAAEQDGERLSEAELLTTCVTLLTAGHETTTNLIGNGLWLLLTHPEQRRLLAERPELMPGAIEEMLRKESPLQRNPRQVAVDVEVRGRQLRAGDYVMQVLGAANHDPAQFRDPHRFDITRAPNRHLAFGQGIHFCLGAPLARLEAPIAIGETLRRLPWLALAEPDAPPRWIRHGLLRGFEELRVTF
ncbi:MAG: cytochrome P450 [Thermomicrobiales bacterium]